MSVPGPDVLGRGIVIRAGDPAPPTWDGAPTVRLDRPTLDDDDTLTELVARLHRAWVARERVIVEWDVPDDALAVDERSDEPPWRHDPGFLFPHERLRFLAFSNNYDARSGAPRWWWSHKAERRIDATPSPTADVVLPDGTEAWIDGGPRQPLPHLGTEVIHGETVDAGLTGFVPTPYTPDDPTLAPDQLEAVRHLAGAARIIAPAGSGKTRTLAARLRHLVTDRAVEPTYVTAVAYNARAATELRERLGADRATVRTIHSLGWAILHDVHPNLHLIDEPEVRNVLGHLVSVPKRANTDPMGPYVEALDEVRAGLRDPQQVESERDDVPGFAAAFERYRSRLYERDRVDHGEQVYGAIEALLRDPALRTRWQNRCRHLLVDEFQDLTPAYLLLLRLVASPQLQVFGVGDDDQVIYGYAGADPGFLIDFNDYFPGSVAHALEVNYRCPPAIVDAASHVLSYNQRRIDKTIRPGRDHQIDHALEVDLRPGPSLATAAAHRIHDWIESGVEPTDIAVLARVNAALIPMKAALVEREVPTHDLLSGQSLRRTAVRALFAWLRIGMRPEHIDRRDVVEAVRRPSRGLTGVTRELVTARTLDLDQLATLGSRLESKQADRWGRFIADLVAVAEAASGNDAADTMRVLIDEVGLASTARTLDAGRTNASRSSHLDDLVAVQRAAALHRDLSDFMPWLGRMVDHPSQVDGVTLSSVHRVKGMEWPHVIVFGADRGAMPHDLSIDLEEERRVFHVAMTRAAEQAVILADVDRPSRFIAELDGTAPRREEPSTRETARRPALRRTTQRVFVGDEVALSGGYEGTVVAVNGTAVSVRLSTGSDLIVPVTDIRSVATTTPEIQGEPDPDLIESLRMWRRETSERLGVPAYVVLHDATIEAIAATKPTTERALISVPGIGAAKLENYGDDILALIDAAVTD